MMMILTHITIDSDVLYVFSYTLLCKSKRKTELKYQKISAIVITVYAFIRNPVDEKQR